MMHKPLWANLELCGEMNCRNNLLARCLSIWYLAIWDSRAKPPGFGWVQPKIPGGKRTSWSVRNFLWPFVAGISLEEFWWWTVWRSSTDFELLGKRELNNGFWKMCGQAQGFHKFAPWIIRNITYQHKFGHFPKSTNNYGLLRVFQILTNYHGWPQTIIFNYFLASMNVFFCSKGKQSWNIPTSPSSKLHHIWQRKLWPRWLKITKNYPKVLENDFWPKCTKTTQGCKQLCRKQSKGQKWWKKFQLASR